MKRRRLGPGVAIGLILALGGVQHAPIPALAAVISSGAAISAPGSQDWPPGPVSPGSCASAQISVTGWLTTVWSAAPRYWITDDQGQRAEVLLDEDLARPFGGPQALDRRRVTVVGEVVRHDPLLIRALSIEPDLS